MPLMISPDGKGWVKVPPKKRTIPITRADQAAVLKSPLSYFACQPVAPSRPKIPDCPVYTLDPNQHTPPTSEQGSPPNSPKKSKRGRSQARSASSPSHHQSRHRHPYDDEYPPSDYEQDQYHTHPSHGAVQPPTAHSTISYDRVRPRRTHAAPTAPRPTPAPKPRAVTTAPTPAPAGSSYTYWTGPSNKPRVPPRSAAWGGGSVSSGSSGASARWANATAPLAL